MAASTTSGLGTIMKTPSKPKTVKQPPAQTVQIEFHDGQAKEVCIAGTFNEWHPAVTPMLHLSHDRWVKMLSLPPGRYEYQLVVDGKWVCDPAATESVPNPFGGCNSVLIVPTTDSERKQQP
jgi:1,4-alpha-glucan branching enzyme